MQNFLKTEFQKLSQSYPKKSLFIQCKGRPKTGLNISTFECHHQEADTILFFIVHALRKTGYDETIIIDAEDTEVIALSWFVANKGNGLLGIKSKKSTYNCQKLCSPELATIIAQLHILTGCDATSSFFGRE